MSKTDGRTSLYGFVWNHIPGSNVVKAAGFIVLLIAILAVCSRWVYPWVETTWDVGGTPTL